MTDNALRESLQAMVDLYENGYPESDHAVRVVEWARLVLLAAEPPVSERGVLVRNTVMPDADRGRALIEFGRAWKLDGDLLVCRGCNRALHVSRGGDPLHHLVGCSNANAVHPWSALSFIIGTAGWHVPERAEPPVVVPSERERIETLKKDVANILTGALSGQVKRYIHTRDGLAYTRWGLVQKDINTALDRALNAGFTEPTAVVSSERERQLEALFGRLNPDLLDEMAEAVERRERDLDADTDQPIVIPLFLAGLAHDVRALAGGTR